MTLIQYESSKGMRIHDPVRLLVRLPSTPEILRSAKLVDNGCDEDEQVLDEDGPAGVVLLGLEIVLGIY